MKVYRVVPDAFLSNRKLDQKSLRGLEGIYYQGGYSSFVGKVKHHDFNSLAEEINSEGKYFFLFAEDAIQEANYLIGSYHKINMDTCLVIEYDIPEDSIFKMLGYDDYSDDIQSIYLIESYVEKNDFGNPIITTDEISTEEKNEILIKSFNESLKRIIESQSFIDLIDYREYFGGKKLESIIDNEQEITKVLLSSSLYNSFMNERRQLIKSPYITGKAVPVSARFWDERFENTNELSDYYKNMGIDCNFSNEQQEYKKEILRYLYLDDDQSQEKAKQLLHQMKH